MMIIIEGSSWKSIWKARIKSIKKGNIILGCSLIVAFLIIVVAALVGSYFFIGSQEPIINDGGSSTDPRGKNCLPIPNFKFDFDEDRNFTMNQNIQESAYVLLKNVNLISSSNVDGKGKVKISNVDILLEKGKISKIANHGSDELKAYEGVDLNGRFVTAGIVDMHSHLGVMSDPLDTRGHDDVNEVSQPLTQMVRSVDALNPKDIAISEIRFHGGVTSSLILPGSANVMGGEGAFVKLKTAAGTVSSMLIRDAPRTLKMACGENPKRVYGRSFKTMPYSRMGSAFLMRKIFSDSKKLMLDQDNWDCNESVRKTTPSRPYDLTLDPVVGLLRGVNITLNVHCYEVQDLEMMIRLSKEFGFKISAFHHALEAYKIADILERNKITVATFADLFGFKVEAYEASVHAPSILRNKNVRVALKSDHPVIHSKYLLLNAAKSHFYGLDEQSALNSVTSVPAEAMGLGNRLGKVEVNYDADIVVWDRFPLMLGARPHQVFIDGNKVDDRNLPIHSTLDHVPKSTQTMKITIRKDDKDQSTTETEFCSYDPETFGKTHTGGYTIKGAKIYTMHKEKPIIDEGNVVVSASGLISCVGTQDECPIPETDGHVTYEIEDGIVVPGLIESSTSLGLYEIEAEPITEDGDNYGMNTESIFGIQSRFGVRMRSRNLRAAWKAGVTTSITHRQGRLLINGLSSVFTLEGLIVSDSLISNSSALYVTIGANSKEGGISDSISAQINYLREVFQSSKDMAIKRVLNREIPVSVFANQADDIGQLIELKNTFGFDMVIIGGAEAHLIADKLVQNNIPVILTPLAEDLSDKLNWETKRSKNNFGASDLFTAGVNLGIGMGTSAHDVRNLRFIAGLVSTEGEKESSIQFMDALSSVTSTISDIFKLGQGVGYITKNYPANLVLFDGNPLNFSGKPKLVAVKNTVDCSIVQF
ncbi:amidohydrolase family protein [Naegleria gruberi]|uniref:Amidohydrolase family protein n=1 Tax=Naegleria gruberi TaxID=5762 RepID=D2V3X6_NAEGR|nr:amidohydrolase family protein [Naegleria gruberi]EFC48278.1 amidohydrolase family protein [Naegleria gruberi]|eukprot:XP_002681022.1 amidohydrolase family protein [Naegleria gruberi strain NEG-M]